MEILNLLTTPVTEFVKFTIPFLGSQIGYLFNYKKNLQNLESKVEELTTMKNGVDRSIQTACRRGDLIKPVVETWLAKAETVRDELMGLNVEAQEINSCFKGWCCGRYHLGKEAKKKIVDVTELLNEGRSISISNSVSDPAPLPTVESSGDFQDFESRESAMNQIIEALKDEEINVVAVYGMGGVGKTTLMKEVMKRAKRDQLFDELVMATVSQNPDLKKIQGEIAEKLGMRRLEEESQSGRAGRLFTRLNEKGILIILDDLWERLDLANVGIHFGNYNKACKVVITTRSLDVCTSMEAQVKIELKVLSEQDSWKLFQQKAGDVVNSSALQTLAMEVANECQGLPLAIVTLGRALQDKDQTVWEDAARQLKKSIFFQGKSPVFSSIKLSFDYLETEEIKRCFLFCCFYPEDWNFSSDMLMRYVIGEELLQNVDTLEEARGRLHTMFDKLLASCLLLKGDVDGRIVMHDIVRDATLSIASELSNGFIVKSGLGLTRWPDRENLITCIRLSLMKNNINELPNQPECPQLLTLALSTNLSLKEFPDSFFESMTSLVTLDLSYTNISLLPSSLACLGNLRTLRLDGTLLSEVSIVGNLKKLELLSISETPLERLPEEIGGLTNLKLLDLSYTRDLKTIPRNLFSGLTRLEELYMLSSFRRWEIEGMGDGRQARLAELASLKCLTILHIRVDDVRCLCKEMPTCWKNLTKFIFNVNGTIWSSKYPKAMAIAPTSDPLSSWVKVLLKRTDELRLYQCKGLKNVVDLDEGEFKYLQSLHIEDCAEMEYVMNVMAETPETAFSDLEELYFWNMKKLKAIYHGPLPNGSLGKLKFLKVFKCYKMTNVVPCDLLVRLENLEELELYKCIALKEVFLSDGLEEGHVIVPRLRKMYLGHLPELTTIWKGVIHRASFESLKSLKVSTCDKLRYLFSRTMVERLQQLEFLEIRSCRGMQKIINLEDERVVEGQEDKKFLPQLTTIKLDKLPMLSSFYQQAVLFDWPSLEVLSVLKCPRLNKLPLGPQSVPNLRNLNGDNIEWFERMEWEDQSVKLRLQPLFQQVVE